MRLAFPVAFLVGACSAQPMTMDAGVDSGIPMPSMITATGMLTGTITAPKATVGYDATNDSGLFALKKTASGQPFKADVTIEFTGMPSVMSYSGTSPGFKCNVTVTSGTAMNDTWVALKNSSAGADKGTCALNFTAVNMTGSGYSVTGSFDITAAAQGGASSGNVTLAGTF